MRYLLILLLPSAAMAQSWGFTAALNGTQTIESFNDGPPTEVSSPYSELLYVTVIEGPEDSASLTIDGVTLPQVMNWPLSGAPAVNTTELIGDAGSLQVSVNPQGYATYDMGVCGSSCTSLTLSGTGAWSDPPAQAPEIDPKGATAGLTLLLGLLLLSGRGPPR